VIPAAAPLGVPPAAHVLRDCEHIPHGREEHRPEACRRALGDPIAPGSVRIYQTYYRDPAPTFCQEPAGGIFNASNGLRVVW
jgi:hypothetical protein